MIFEFSTNAFLMINFFDYIRSNKFNIQSTEHESASCFV